MSAILVIKIEFPSPTSGIDKLKFFYDCQNSKVRTKSHNDRQLKFCFTKF